MTKCTDFMGHESFKATSYLLSFKERLSVHFVTWVDSASICLLQDTSSLQMKGKIKAEEKHYRGKLW